MVNMRMLIRIVFAIFIANGIDCFGSDSCCIPPKYENISKGENNIAESLVNDNWYKSKKNNLVLKIFKKKDDDVFPSKDNGDKISFKLDEKNNTKISYLQKMEIKFHLNWMKVINLKKLIKTKMKMNLNWKINLI